MRDSDATGGQTAVNPDGLRALGGKLSPIANKLAAAHKAGADRLHLADSAGSAALAAATQAAVRWYTYTQALASRTATAGIDLTAAANAYTGTDTAATAHAQRVHRDLDRAE